MARKRRNVKEGIAQISSGNVNRTRVVGRNEFGEDIEEKVPTMYSEWMMDKAGNILAQALCCHRVTTEKSLDKYGRSMRLDLILDVGLIPVRECPHTRKYMDEMTVPGPLVPVPEEFTTARGTGRNKELVFEGCEGATIWEGDPVSPAAKKAGVLQATTPVPKEPAIFVVPCKHFLAFRKRLIERNAKRIAIQEQMVADKPADAILELAKSIERANKASGIDVTVGRNNLRAGQGEPEVEADG